MGSEIETSIAVLTAFRERRSKGDARIDRPEVVAHALLSALEHHWPSFASAHIKDLLNSTDEIKRAETSRWMTQRRIAIAKLSQNR